MIEKSYHLWNCVNFPIILPSLVSFNRDCFLTLDRVLLQSLNRDRHLVFPQ